MDSKFMRLHVGTSGFAYKEWIGVFYPEGMRDREMLAWYASQFETVEINNTFYRFPTVSGLTAWATQVPEEFLFAIKVPQRITHIKRIHEVEEDVSRFIETVTTLAARLGPLLFQFPPRMPPDNAALRDLTLRFPPKLRVAFEFRDSGWLCEPVYELLAERNCALCFNDARMQAPLSTADWGYVRLRRDHYDEKGLATTAAQVLAQPWRETFIYVKHEAPDSPLVARQWLTIASTMTQLV